MAWVDAEGWQRIRTNQSPAHKAFAFIVLIRLLIPGLAKVDVTQSERLYALTFH
ncbi:hypothetical protein [Mesorhizobium amorphae]|uniref:hypothetical protein n=1 Tax=Mesorhizobium amorphae TaxID=71433 RepID=UPI001782619F|nr:hypothetical protein [Mesorhizobium amorphae]